MSNARLRRVLTHAAAFTGGVVLSMGTLAMVQAPPTSAAEPAERARPMPMQQLVGFDVEVQLIDGDRTLWGGELASIDATWVQLEDRGKGPLVFPTFNVASIAAARGDVRDIRQAADDAENAAASDVAAD